VKAISLCRSRGPVGAIDAKNDLEKVAVEEVPTDERIARQSIERPRHQAGNRDLLANHDPEILGAERIDRLPSKFMTAPNEICRVFRSFRPGWRVEVIQRLLVHVGSA
jgi:hypothetical protein